MEKNDGSYRRWYGEICGIMRRDDRGEKERGKSSENLPRGPTYIKELSSIFEI